ncbi:MAG: alpha/beta hydrolase [Burkholderiaceae bacterium]|nr:alpha/beta hydrolase [Burkholderiaceae bacterium]
MFEPSLNFVTCPDAKGSHRMAYWLWGATDSPHVIVCAHGLTRQGRDFDVLARALCAAAPGRLRVVCPDVVGRGKSDWLKDPVDYQVPNYVADMLVLLGQLQPKTLDWVGTSMGGLIGMVVSGQPDLPLPAPVRRLVLNDVGPVIEWRAIQRIAQYLGNTGHFDTVQQATDAMWAVSTSFGPHTPEQWLALSMPMLKALPSTGAGESGGYSLNYDPGLAVPFAAATEETAKQGEVLLWALYDNIKAQTLITRGAESDLLSVATASAMTQRGPKARLVEFAGVGHAPTFVAQNQVDTVVDFLLK